MHRIDALDNVANEFSDGDPVTGVPGTQFDAAFMNAVQDELVAVIEAMGVTLVKGTNTQLLEALRTGVHMAIIDTDLTRKLVWQARQDTSGGLVTVEFYVTASGDFEIVRGASWSEAEAEWSITGETGPAFRSVLGLAGWTDYDVADDATSWTDAQWNKVGPEAIVYPTTFLNSWATLDAQPSGEQAFGYYKTRDGIVRFVGAIKDGAGAVLDMPSGFRSAKTCRALVPGGANISDMAVVGFDLITSRIEVHHSTGNAIIDFSGFSYLADGS